MSCHVGFMFRACAHLPTKALLGLSACLTRIMSFMLAGALKLFAAMFVLKKLPSSLKCLFQSETRKLPFSRKLATYLPSKDLRGIKRSSRVTDERLSVEEGTPVSTVTTSPRIDLNSKKGQKASRCYQPSLKRVVWHHGWKSTTAGTPNPTWKQT